jgi:hypothetical protein
MKGRDEGDLGDIRERGRSQRPCTLIMDTRLWIVEQKHCVLYSWSLLRSILG